MQLLNDNVGFVNTGENPIPLFFGEFGINQKDVTPDHDHFLSCFLLYAIQRDLDWSLWAWQGGYYIRDRQPEVDEIFGILDMSWSHIRNLKVQQKLQLMKTKIQGKI